MPRRSRCAEDDALRRHERDRVHARGRRALGGFAVGVRILFGSPPSPPPVLSAEVLLGLYAPDGSRPCRVGLGRALRWIGDREIQLELALEEAKSVLAPSDLEWGLIALGISGGDYGDGYDFSDGAGDG